MASAVGVLAGGWVVSRFKLKLKNCAVVMFTTYFLGSLMYFSAMFFYCDQYIADKDMMYTNDAGYVSAIRRPSSRPSCGCARSRAAGFWAKGARMRLTGRMQRHRRTNASKPVRDRRPLLRTVGLAF